MPWTPPAADPVPDAALSRALSRCLPGGALGGPLLAFASLPSTQTLARVLAEGGAPAGTVVVADHQTAGRGRRGRTWTAPPGSALLFSSVLRPGVDPVRWPELTLVAGCAVAEALEREGRVAARLKWPNDVLIAGQKIAGILSEGVVGERGFAIVGVGVNLTQRREDWPADLVPRATSLAARGVRVGREALLACILERLGAWHDEWLTHGFAPVRRAWLCHAGLDGEHGTEIASPDGDGVAVDLAPSGALVVRRRDGRIVSLVSDGPAWAEPAPGGRR